MRRQTADTFDAAATFFDLTHEWGTPEPDVLQKIKFAKWNAARILKAIRQGEDPNESNPQPREADDEPALDPLDPAVQELTSPAPPVQAAYVEDVPDGGEPSRPEPVQDGYFPPQNEPFVPSPMSTSPPPPPQQQQPAESSLPMIPPHFTPQPTPMSLTPQPPPQFSSYAPPPPPPQPPQPSVPPSWTAPTVAVPPAVASPTPAPVPVVAPPVAGLASAGRVVADQKSIAQAQKHAKFAISALNFDDVPTAIKELRNALATLGAL